jgi:transposase InsO family protein
VFWIILSKIYSKWKDVLIIVQPQTVIRWHKSLFKIYWARKSKYKRKSSGRSRISKEIQNLIAKLTRENITWGAPRILKERMLLGFKISESTVHRYRDRSTKPPSQTWRTFLKSHKADTVAIDFLTVPTVRFSLLYCFIILDHSRRKIIHFNVTYNPTAEWTGLEVKQAFPWVEAPKYLLRDNDKIYGEKFYQTIDNMSIEQVRISPYCPWQNPYVERFMGTLRRDCLDHMIILGEDHLYEIVKEFVSYYNNSRCHESLEGNSPIPRKVENGKGKIISKDFLGGLHHRYSREVA